MFRVRATADGVIVIKLQTDPFTYDHVALNAIKLFSVKARPLNPIAQYNLFGASNPSDEHMCFREVQRYEQFPEDTACGYNRDLNQWVSCKTMDPSDNLKLTARETSGNNDTTHAVSVLVSFLFISPPAADIVMACLIPDVLPPPHINLYIRLRRFGRHSVAPRMGHYAGTRR